MEHISHGAIDSVQRFEQGFDGVIDFFKFLN